MDAQTTNKQSPSPLERAGVRPTLANLLLEIAESKKHHTQLMELAAVHLNAMRLTLQSLDLEIENAATIDPWRNQERDHLQLQLTAAEIELEQFITA